MKKEILAIIPCCGYGTRMNMEHDKSKELLEDPQTGQPLIQWHINICRQMGVEPLIVTRPGKKDLIEYCIENSIAHFITTPGQEWQHTIFNSHPFWSDANIVLFPDSRFSPIHALSVIKNFLSAGADLALGIFPVETSKEWCVLTRDGIYEKHVNIEKPFDAIGIFGFSRVAGLKLFGSLISNYFYRLGDSESVATFELTSFKDLTRNGRIEKY